MIGLGVFGGGGGLGRVDVPEEELLGGTGGGKSANSGGGN
jgi:hypothetical protein